MWLELARRLSLTLLIVAVAAGFAVPAAYAGSHHHQAVASMASADNFRGGCTHESCPIGPSGDMHGICIVSASGVDALAPATGILYFASAPEVLTPSFDRALVECTIPPDPHPPKRI
jgi:hypothetical protein